MLARKSRAIIHIKNILTFAQLNEYGLFLSKIFAY